MPPDVESLLLLDGCTLLIGSTLDVVAEDRSKVENDVISPGDISKAGFFLSKLMRMGINSTNLFIRICANADLNKSQDRLENT